MDTDIEGVERQVTSRILILTIGKCLDYLQNCLSIDMGLVWYGEVKQFVLGHTEFDIWLYIQVEISWRQLEIQHGGTVETQVRFRYIDVQQETIPKKEHRDN